MVDTLSVQDLKFKWRRDGAEGRRSCPTVLRQTTENPLTRALFTRDPGFTEISTQSPDLWATPFTSVLGYPPASSLSFPSVHYTSPFSFSSFFCLGVVRGGEVTSFILCGCVLYVGKEKGPGSPKVWFSSVVSEILLVSLKSLRK